MCLLLLYCKTIDLDPDTLVKFLTAPDVFGGVFGLSYV